MTFAAPWRHDGRAVIALPDIVHVVLSWTRRSESDWIDVPVGCSLRLQRWSAIAERVLRAENTPTSVLALSLGYTSEGFRRTMGMAPKRYRDAVRADDGAHRLASSAAGAHPVTTYRVRERSSC